jgi:hypothetical protein
MPQRASKNDSSATSKTLFELDLPVVGTKDAPLPHPEPSFELQMQHAEFVLRSQPPDFYEKRLAAMNPEPFVLR